MRLLPRSGLAYLLEKPGRLRSCLPEIAWTLPSGRQRLGDCLALSRGDADGAFDQLWLRRRASAAGDHQYSRKPESGSAVRDPGEAEWLVCEEICIPGDATLELSLPVSNQTPAINRQAEALFDWG